MLTLSLLRWLTELSTECHSARVSRALHISPESQAYSPLVSPSLPWMLCFLHDSISPSALRCLFNSHHAQCASEQLPANLIPLQYVCPFNTLLLIPHSPLNVSSCPSVGISYMTCSNTGKGKLRKLCTGMEFKTFLYGGNTHIAELRDLYVIVTDWQI